MIDMLVKLYQLPPLESEIAAMKEARAGNLPRVNSIDELKAALHADD